MSSGALPPPSLDGTGAAVTRSHPRSLRSRFTGLGLSAPALLFVGAFVGYPLASLLFLSVHDYSPIRSTDTTFVGLDNFAWLATSDMVRQSLWVTLVFTMVSVSIEMVVGLALATLLARVVVDHAGPFARTMSRVFGGVLLLPFAAPAVVSAIAWKLLLHPQFGPVNATFDLDIAWFSDWALAAVIVTDAWKMMPFVLFLLFAAIVSVEPTQYEAATLDGAGRWQEFRSITLPSILPVLVVTAAFRAVDAFTKIFDTVFATTGGGPGHDTAVFPLLIWKTAFEQLRFGQASALAVAAIVISGLLAGGLIAVRRVTTS